MSDYINQDKVYIVQSAISIEVHDVVLFTLSMNS